MNNSLTLDNLTGMNGKKVWVQDKTHTNEGKYTGWHTVDIENKILEDESGSHYLFVDINNIYIVYKDKPTNIK